jgi:hypothetical protein
MKEAVLDFARRRELPPPSWWADTTSASKGQTNETHLAKEQGDSKISDELAEQEARAAEECRDEERDRAEPAAPTPAPIPPPSAPGAVDLTNVAPQLIKATSGNRQKFGAQIESRDSRKIRGASANGSISPKLRADGSL